MKKEEICCPRFDPTGWDEKNFEWKGKNFIIGEVKTFMYMPINFGQVMTRLNALIESTGGMVPENLCLAETASKWKMKLLLATDRKIAGAENVIIDGKFISKVYEGSFNETGKWMQDFDNFLKEKKAVAKKTYTWYTTCPKCAKKYGKNYVVLIAEI